ncbi:MAG TPA: hypothetical protein VNW29_03215 [Candidatus Sulfotelmatobacter sp.]|nr:hypothetical protein [Candidatus Sulfotelmatobacter sp.]
MTSVAEAGKRFGFRQLDSYPVLPPGVLPVQTLRPDLDFSKNPRDDIARKNTQLPGAERRFFGNPNGFPDGTTVLSPVYTIKTTKERAIATRPPNPYFPEAALTLVTNRPQPTSQEIERERLSPTPTIIDTVQYPALSRAARLHHTAMLLGAFEAAIDTAAQDPKTIKPIGIIHHAPVTSAEFSYPRSAGDLHSTTGVVRKEDLLPEIGEQPLFTEERKLMTPRVNTRLADHLTDALADIGYDPEELRVVPRGTTKPHGVGIHIMGLTENNLTSSAGLSYATDVFDAIDAAYRQVYDTVFKDLPPSLEHRGRIIKRSPVPAHRLVFHLSEKNDQKHTSRHAVYGLVPITFETSAGGAEVCGVISKRRVETTTTPRQLERIEAFNKLAIQRMREAANIIYQN